MAPARRIGAENSETRALLLDAAQQLMCEEGYAAVTSRRLAGRAGLKPQLVHYYFRTMDDLFLALFQRVADAFLRRQEMPLDSRRPLKAIWDISNTAADAVLYIEFMALANHRKALRAAIAEFGDSYRRRQAERIGAILTANGVDIGTWEPIMLATLMETVSRCLGFEALLGMTVGRDETLATVHRTIDRLEGAPVQERKPRKAIGRRATELPSKRRAMR